MTTLKNILNLSSNPVSLEKTSLVLLNFQEMYRTGILKLDQVEAAINEAATILKCMRENGRPVIHVVHHTGPGSLFKLDEFPSDIIRELAPLPDEIIVYKGRPSAFAMTDFHVRLQRVKAHDVIFTGFMTHMCLSSTVRAAYDLGYKPIIVGAATATRNIITSKGVHHEARNLQRESLVGLADIYATVYDTFEDLKAIEVHK